MVGREVMEAKKNSFQCELVVLLYKGASLPEGKYENWRGVLLWLLFYEHEKEVPFNVKEEVYGCE